MAYRSFEADFVETAAIDQAEARRSSGPDLGPIEALAVAIGMHDAPWSLHGEGWLARWTRRIFGLGPAQPLADPRLESLRRLAVSLRYRPDAAATEIAAAHAVGITHRQVIAIAERIRASRFAYGP